jgi:IS30 family transposase
MGQINYNTSHRFGKHLSFDERLRIEDLLQFKPALSIREIARRLGRSPSTVSREIKRGSVSQIKYKQIRTHKSYPHSQYTYEIRKDTYFADFGQNNAKEHLGRRGGKFKLMFNLPLLRFIEDKILDEKWSPAAVAGYLNNHEHSFGETVCFKTIYNYIDKGLCAVKNLDLLLKVKLKPRKKKRNAPHKREYGLSIDLRPEEVDDRISFGHWEGDTVASCKKGEGAILTLVERKTRKGIMIKINDKSSECVMEALEPIVKDKSEIFKSITFDNGCEFSRCSELMESIYYAHPYSSWERGSNENYNGIIRRFIPKGKDIADVEQRMLNRINNWIDNYPRGINCYKSANERFEEELEKLSQTAV